LAFSKHKFFDPAWWYYGDGAGETPDWEPDVTQDPLIAPEPNAIDFELMLEAAINRSYLNPLFKSVQVVEFCREAKLFVEVECLDGKIRKGWVTWAN